MQTVEKWGVFEAAVSGKSKGNPFVDYTIRAVFEGKKETVTADGFYDGDGIYKVRFMPSFEGEYTYKISGTFSDQETTGTFHVTPVTSENNHGPVRVKDKLYLAYEDGTPYYSIGTTCYAWACQPMSLQEQTLQTLSENVFNKIRFCFFPKFYKYNLEEPITYPFERGEKKGQQSAEEQAKVMNFQPKDAPGVQDVTDFNCYRPNPEHFRIFDERIAQLSEMGIEADMILFHPYDKWGFASMNAECNDIYLKYVTARYSAYRNIWWSLANEYDLFGNKSIGDWEHYAQLIGERDPYHHMCSIHNCMKFYDYSKPWITHCSLQRIDFYKHVELTEEFIQKYEKPAVWDEIVYEGNIDMGWGNIGPQEMVRRFWEAFLRGGHAGHGETYMNPDDILWWSKGGVLHGESHKRFKFLLDIMKETPGHYLKAAEGAFDEVLGIPVSENRVGLSWFAEPVSYEIRYYGIGRPSFKEIKLSEGKTYEIEVIDTYEMTIENKGTFTGTAVIELPGKEYMAIRLREVKS